MISLSDTKVVEKYETNDSSRGRYPQLGQGRDFIWGIGWML